MYRVLLLIGIITLPIADHAAAVDLNPSVYAWLGAQTNIQGWSADFVQTRSFKTLTQPLRATGHVWFEAPNRFRWEIQKPQQTIAVRATQELLILYPRLKRVERFPLIGEQTGPWRDALALLEAGFPRGEADLVRQYNIVSQKVTDDTGQLVLQPKSAAAKRMIPQITIEFDTRDHSLKGTELQFADGSKMRNDFQNPQLNPKIEPTLFAPGIPSDYKVVEPLKSK